MAFTPNYFIPAATALLSVLSSSGQEARFHVICLLTEDLSEDYKERLHQLDGGSGRMTWAYMNLSDALQGVYVDPKYTIAASFRLVVAELLPQYDRVIYMDCDMIIRQDLAKLYRELDLGECYLAGVAEANTPYQEERVLKRLDIPKGAYINSGFLVLNLALIRRDGLTERFLEALRVDYLEFPDQDVLNMVCRGRILYLPPYYNGIRTFMHPAFKDNFLRYYSLEDWDTVQSKGTIHYTGEKPWRAYANGFEQWWAMYDRLPVSVREGIPVSGGR